MKMLFGMMLSETRKTQFEQARYHITPSRTRTGDSNGFSGRGKNC